MNHDLEHCRGVRHWHTKRLHPQCEQCARYQAHLDDVCHGAGGRREYMAPATNQYSNHPAFTCGSYLAAERRATPTIPTTTKTL